MKYYILPILFLSAAVFFACNQNESRKGTGKTEESVSNITIRDSIPPNIDSLRKYSYLIITLNNKDTIGNGTGFFVKKCNRIFLVSAFHMLFGRYPDYSFLSPRINKISVRYEGLKNDGWSYFTINIDSAFMAQPFGAHDKPFPVDTYCYELPNLIKAPINTIDLDNSATFDNNIHNGSMIVSFGFPAGDYRTERNYDKRNANIISGNLKDYTPGKGGAVNFFVSIKGQGGRSGAPLFAFYNDNGSIVYRFMGIEYASGGESMEVANLMAIKPYYIDNIISLFCK